MVRFAQVMVMMTFVLSAHGQESNASGSAGTLPPESCAPPPLHGQALLEAASNDGALLWSSDLAESLKQAKAQQREVLVYFRDADCDDCDRMQATTFADSYIQSRLGGFVLVRLDVNTHLESARLNGISAVPALVRLSSEGKIISKHSGRLDKDRFLDFLRQKTTGIP